MSYDSILSSRSGLLIIISGISSSGKTTLAKGLSKKYNYPVLSMDDYKVKVYEEFGFESEYERKLLWNMAKNMFCTDIIKNARTGCSFIVEYAFDISWQEFFEYVSGEYDFNTIVINCNSRSFEDIWKSRVERDSTCVDRAKCLTASKYVKGKLYENNGKLNDKYKDKKKKDYEDGVYTSLYGDLVISDSDLLG